MALAITPSSVPYLPPREPAGDLEYLVAAQATRTFSAARGRSPDMDCAGDREAVAALFNIMLGLLGAVYARVGDVQYVADLVAELSDRRQ